MKKALYLLAFLCTITSVKSQLYVQGGAMFHVGGTVTLQDEDFIRGPEGGAVITFEPGSNVLFTGNADNNISGYIGFLNLEIAKSDNHQVSLQNYNEEVTGQMVFTSGNFNLNNNTLLLGSTGTLINENENSRIIGATDGKVQARPTLNQPTNINPGNIGAGITSIKNLGEVIINRGYIFQAGLPSNAIQRYYEFNFIDPGKDNGLDATLRLHYFDAELAGADETKLVHWKYDYNSLTWADQGATGSVTRNTVDNWVQLTGIESLSPWTLAETSGPLPVIFSLFNVACKNNAVAISWQTATEINTNHFEVQRSTDGINWITLFTQQALGHNGVMQNYNYTDPRGTSLNRVFYRIKSVDNDGKENYTSINTTSCNNQIIWHVWPNPVKQQLNINIKLDGAYKTTVQLFDSKGALVHQSQKDLLTGNNQFAIELMGLPPGIYHLCLKWDGDKNSKNIKIIKQ